MFHFISCSGLSSVVRRCTNKETGKEYAVKIIDRYSEKGKAMKGRDEEQQVKTEIETLNKVAGHPNISKNILSFPLYICKHISKECIHMFNHPQTQHKTFELFECNGATLASILSIYPYLYVYVEKFLYYYIIPILFCF